MMGPYRNATVSITHIYQDVTTPRGPMSTDYTTSAQVCRYTIWFKDDSLAASPDARPRSSWNSLATDSQQPEKTHFSQAYQESDGYYDCGEYSLDSRPPQTTGERNTRVSRYNQASLSQFDRRESSASPASDHSPDPGCQQKHSGDVGRHCVLSRHRSLSIPIRAKESQANLAEEPISAVTGSAEEIAPYIDPCEEEGEEEEEMQKEHLCYESDGGASVTDYPPDYWKWDKEKTEFYHVDEDGRRVVFPDEFD